MPWIRPKKWNPNTGIYKAECDTEYKELAYYGSKNDTFFNCDCFQQKYPDQAIKYTSTKRVRILRKNIQLSSSLNNMVNMMDSIDVDSFLEVEDMHGMSAEAYGTLEMIEMHKSLKEGFSFEQIPR
eukprot:g14180.t1